MWIAEREQVVTNYNPTRGSFGWTVNTNPNPPAPAAPEADPGTPPPVTINTWETCRERFLQHQAGLKAFYFKHELPLGRGRSIAVFLEKLEKKLGIKSSRRTKVQATSKRKIVKIEPSRFWDQSEIRRSLLSAMIRASVNYRITTDNFETALYSVSYTQDTRRAVKRFIEDRATHFWPSPGGNATGWCSTFVNATNAEIGRRLRKSRKLKHPRRVPVEAVPSAATPPSTPEAA